MHLQSHIFEIFAEIEKGADLGYDAETISKLHAEKVVG
jgi:hypothetical protein